MDSNIAYGKNITVAKKPTQSRKLSVYSNLSHRRKTKKDAESRQRAQYLATLPKHPVKRFFYKMHPKRFWAYWFSKRGAIMALKVTGVGILLLLLLVGGLFAYFRKDLDAIRPGELAKRVQTTVTKYYDRNGILLWEDTGGGDYKLVVDSKDLSTYLKQATIAIEDRDFYSHNGVSPTGLIRAVVNNAGGGDIQGGSTLTQQLVKQVFFATEAGNRGLSGIPRKIKELILAVEVERMYDKDQILTLYLNESPYGGPRNGAESGAQAYFGKAAKDLTLPEAALLAAIPQNPSVYNPYKPAGHEALIARQHVVLDNMADQGMITKAQADEAKKYPIIDSLISEASQFEGIKAPHFVQMVKNQIESELGKATVGRGGLTITTTLDYRIQAKLEESMASMFASSVPSYAGFTNGAATVEDSQSGQIVALMGSRDFLYDGYGQDNASTAYIQPGSTIKSLVYSQLFQQKATGMANYGSGSILKDENIDSIYGAKLQNADRTFKGDITIRTSLATSRNVPAVKAMYISGVAPTLKTIHDMGATSYCTQGDETQVGLAAAIGGCGIKQVDLVNAYASLARGGVYKKQASVLEVKNSSGEVLKKWTDDSAKKVIDPQSAYIVSDMLSDSKASAALGSYAAKAIPGVRTSTKTGTSDKGGNAKDIWMMSYSPALTMSLWLGNPDTTVLKQGTSSLGSPIIAKVMEYAHKDVYAPEGKWKSGDWFVQPAGIQRVGTELYPSWWNKTQGQTNAKLTFDTVSKKKATDCTPAGAKLEVSVTKMVDPVTKKDVFIAPDGYDSSKDDDVHKCDDVKPTVTVGYVPGPGVHTITVSGTVTQGTFALGTVDIKVGGTSIKTLTTAGAYTFSYAIPTGSTAQSLSATVTDSGLYSDSMTGPTQTPTNP
jgi:membrane peptidoglycan carboxypeptidase